MENDDRASMFSVRDLLRLHDMCAPHLPIVYDFHHWRFCTGVLGFSLPQEKRYFCASMCSKLRLLGCLRLSPTCGLQVT